MRRVRKATHHYIEVEYWMLLVFCPYKINLNKAMNVSAWTMIGASTYFRIEADYWNS